MLKIITRQSNSAKSFFIFSFSLNFLCSAIHAAVIDAAVLKKFRKIIKIFFKKASLLIIAQFS